LFLARMLFLVDFLTRAFLAPAVFFADASEVPSTAAASVFLLADSAFFLVEAAFLAAFLGVDFLSSGMGFRLCLRLLRSAGKGLRYRSRQEAELPSASSADSALRLLWRRQFAAALWTVPRARHGKR